MRIKLDENKEHAPVLIIGEEENQAIAVEKFYPHDRITEVIRLDKDESRKLYAVLKEYYGDS